MTDFIQLETMRESRFPFACSACGFWANAVLRVNSTGGAAVNATGASALRPPTVDVSFEDAMAPPQAWRRAA